MTEVNAAPGWLDLSGTRNRRPWAPAPADPQAGDLGPAAAGWFGCAPRQVQLTGGGLTADRLSLPGCTAVVGPGCSRHAAGLRAAGWRVLRAGSLAAMPGADLAVVANPCGTDGREWPPAALADLARRVGHLVVDETLADTRPDLTLATNLPPNALILRGMDSFWGLEGHGFVLAEPVLRAPLADGAPVGALRLAAQALADRAWAEDTILYHAEAALWLDRLALRAGWQPAGGTHLFRVYDFSDAKALQQHLTRARIGVRRLGARRLRLAIPACRDEWDRLERALPKI